jgi:UDP-N-acetylenolpyruvoylglucosamine reductase
MDARSELTKTALIRRNKQEKSLAIHRLVQETARVLMEPDMLSSVFAFAVHILELNWVEDRELTFGYRTSEWQVADSITPHVFMLKSIYDRQKVTLEVDSLRGYTSLVSRVSTYEKRPYRNLQPTSC